MLTLRSFYIVGVAVLFLTSLPAMLERGAGPPGLIVAMVLISLGLGGVKATLPPFLAEQCYSVEQGAKDNRHGRRVMVDHEATVAHAFDVYYWYGIAIPQ